MKLCVYNSVCRTSQLYWFLIVLLVRADVDSDALSAREKPVTSVFHPRFTYPVRPQTPTPAVRVLHPYPLYADIRRAGETVRIREPSFKCELLAAFLPAERVFDAFMQLRFASGSLRQYLEIEYTAKLPDSTIDNPEKQLYDFVPPGSLIGFRLLWQILTTHEDYFKDPITFKQQVEKDAIAFKPMGKKIYSYSRRASARSDVERRGEVDTSVNEEDKDAVVFEVYHVRCSTYCETSSLTTL